MAKHSFLFFAYKAIVYNFYFNYNFSYVCSILEQFAKRFRYFLYIWYLPFLFSLTCFYTTTECTKRHSLFTGVFFFATKFSFIGKLFLIFSTGTHFFFFNFYGVFYLSTVSSTGRIRRHNYFLK